MHLKRMIKTHNPSYHSGTNSENFRINGYKEPEIRVLFILTFRNLCIISEAKDRQAKFHIFK